MRGLIAFALAMLVSGCVPDGSDAADGGDCSAPAPDILCSEVSSCEGWGARPCTHCVDGEWTESHVDCDPELLPRFQTCGLAPTPARTTRDWLHPVTTGATVLAGEPDHSAQDVITVEGRDVILPGKFAYGAVSKDLEDEWIEVYLDDCSGELVELGRQRTDSDGRIALSLPAADLPPVGAYRLYLRVQGDDSSTHSWLRVVLSGTQAIVADIDGTLTTSDLELFQDIFAEYFAPLGAGTYTPVARPGAIDLSDHRRFTDGYLLIFLTGRPYYLTDLTRGWLEDQGLAPAHLHLTDSNAEAVPTNAGVGAFKADYLEEMKALGIELVAGYGNATTDIHAFEQAGIDKASTFIVGKHGGEQGTVDLGEDYLGHLQDLATGLRGGADQPFEW